MAADSLLIRCCRRSHGGQEYIEFLTFPENCAAEDAALSLKQKLGRGEERCAISRQVCFRACSQDGGWQPIPLH